MPGQERVFFALNVSPSTQVGLISESSDSGEGHAEDHRQAQQQKRKRASDLQDKGTYLQEGKTGPGMWWVCVSGHLENSIWAPAGA